MVAMQSHFPHLVSKKLTGWPQFQKKKEAKLHQNPKP